jgi:mannose-6-phosphate isomerase-like protein (cupin superfamily)
MFTEDLNACPVNRRGNGQVSHLLLAPGQFGSKEMAITWVECAPGSQQRLHAHHGREQVYVIARGRGRMIVGDEEQEVVEGTLVFIPPGPQHAIHNPGPDVLVYISASAPPFELPTGEFAYEPQEAGRDG